MNGMNLAIWIPTCIQAVKAYSHSLKSRKMGDYGALRWCKQVFLCSFVVRKWRLVLQDTSKFAPSSLMKILIFVELGDAILIL
ncbi:hypothetical protein [Cellvibrio zantedeschiae]|uniref:hypothetical protein n=1 Tax=Cellvibrio zantedeschiae TaxID=1237077 RepID=UPI001675C6EF|nr:hypothetical protein [Cellvibrio zantedeschiae]